MSTFEEAYDTTALLTCGFILLYVTTECLGVGYVLNRAECDLDITVTERGLIAASTLIGVVTPAIFWGYMGDEYGRRKVMLPTILATVVVSICSSMAVNFWNIISASCATVYVYLGFGWAILPHKWSLPITGDLNLVPWRVFMWAWCLWGVLAAIGLYILPESPRYLLATRGPEAVVPVLAKMYAWNHNLHVDDYPTTLTSMCSLMNSKYSGGEHAHHQHETAECRTVAINNLMYPISMVTGVLTAIIALALCTLFMIGRLGAAMGAHLVGMGLQANCTMFNNLALLTCGFILLYVTTECLGAGYMLNGAECDLNISVTERGFVAAATFIAIFWGYLADTYGRRRVMLPAILGTITISICSSLSVSFWNMFILRLLTGCLVSASIATVYAFLGELHTASHRASALAYGSAFIACSLFIMPVVRYVRAAPAAQNHSIRQDCTMTEDRKTEATPFEDALDKT
ncbi:hypothetical protein MSG28_008311, partial [Choristoneura fumiferana]